MRWCFTLKDRNFSSRLGLDIVIQCEKKLGQRKEKPVALNPRQFEILKGVEYHEEEEERCR